MLILDCLFLHCINKQSKNKLRLLKIRASLKFSVLKPVNYAVFDIKISHFQRPFFLQIDRTNNSLVINL